MTRIIAIANQKGGVGKTTTCVNLAAAFAVSGRRVLLIDLDPQGNATVASNTDKHNLESSINEVLLGEVDARDAICDTDLNYDLIPSNSDLTVAEVRLVKLEGREQALSKALATVSDGYDYILIDCPPALNILTVNAFIAANSILIPMQCEFYALEGLQSLMDTFEKIRAAANSKLEIEGLLRTMYDARNRLSWDVSNQLKDHFGSHLLHTVIPRNVRLAEAPSYGKPAINHDRRSQGSIAYLALAGELIRRQEDRNKSKPKSRDAISSILSEAEGVKDYVK